MVRKCLPNEMALRRLLGNLSSEMLVLASTANAIEDDVGDLISKGVPGAERLLVPLQGLDHLAQTANDLAGFIAAISQSVDPRTVISISDHIHSIGLRALAESLAGHSSETSRRTDGVGEVDLF
jgi:hypothetical protein